MATQVREISAVKDAQMREAAEKSGRSVFVGNIPYEASDEELKDIFSQAGPVLSFRLVYDRESGKPKGYGFCEYKDQETAQSAMRNLNGTELHGRQLRVDSAASQKGANDDPKAYMKEISPYGAPVPPEQAPETITSAVASLPPEQMFELMKQMKLCIQNNPEEARQMLLQNPQLAYALLQAQVIMKIVDPKVADAILHQPRGQPLPIKQLMDHAGIGPTSAPAPQMAPNMHPPPVSGPPVGAPAPDWRGEGLPMPHPGAILRPAMEDLRVLPPQERGPPLDDRMRAMPGARPNEEFRDVPIGQPRGLPLPAPLHPDPRAAPIERRLDVDMRPTQNPFEDRVVRDDRMRDPRPTASREPQVDMRPPPDARDPRYRQPPVQIPPASGAPLGFGAPANAPPAPVGMPVGMPRLPAGLAALTGVGGPGGPSEEEKQRLIMQVLALTEDQIRSLPEDQRDSIRLLKTQISQSQR